MSAKLQAFFGGIIPVAAAILLLAGCWRSAAAENDFWDGRFQPPGISGSEVSAVYAVLLDGTNVIVGGHFLEIDSLSAINVARFNGVEWSAMGSGLGGVTTFVYALAKGGTNIYAGGDFGGSGGTILNHVARWDGQFWQPIGTGGPIGTDATVFALNVKPNGDLFVGGAFRNVNGVAASGIARWNGTGWFSLTNATGQGVDKSVLAIAFQGEDLIAGGNFDFAGGVVATRIARWDGSAWSAVGAGISSQSGSFVQTLAVDGADMYVGGRFDTVNGSSVFSRAIARHNSTNGWSGLGNGVVGAGEVRGLGLVGSDVYVAGSFGVIGATNANNIARWDGSAWHAVGSGLNAEAHALQAGGEDLFAGGVFDEAGGKLSARFAIYSNPTRLNATPAPTTTTLTWRISAFAYTLQTSTNLSDADGWSAVATPPTMVGTNHVVIDLKDGPQRFYRLYRP